MVTPYLPGWLSIAGCCDTQQKVAHVLVTVRPQTHVLSLLSRHVVSLTASICFHCFHLSFHFISYGLITRQLLVRMFRGRTISGCLNNRTTSVGQRQTFQHLFPLKGHCQIRDFNYYSFCCFVLIFVFLCEQFLK